MKTSLVLGLALLVLVRAGPWTELFAFDCTGNAHFFPSNDLLTTSVKTYARTAANFLGDTIIESVKCHCPDLTDEVAEKYFGPLSVGNMIYGVSTEPQSIDYQDGIDLCGEDSFVFSFMQPYDYIQFDFPDTCTTDTWENDGTCLLQYQMNSDIDIQLAFAQCPDDNERLPFISLNCEGDECDQLFRPCATDDDCTGTCQEIFENATMEAEDAVQEMLEGWLGIVSTGFDSSCDYGSDGVGAKLLQDMFSFIAPFMGGDADSVTSMHFCGLDNLKNYDSIDDFVESSVENTCNITEFFAETNDTDTYDCYCDDEDDYNNTFSCSCDDSEGIVIDCSAIVDWDGDLSTGESAVSASRLDGTEYPDLTIDSVTEHDGVYNLFHVSCDSEIAFFYGASQDIVARAPRIHEFGQAWGTSVQEIMACQEPGVDEADVRIRDFTYQPGMWLSLIDELDDAFDIDFGLDDFYADLQEDADDEEDGLTVVMPDGCTYENWLETGTCALEFTGLQALIEEDITIRLVIAECSEHPDSLVTVWADCIGDFCDDVLRVYELEYCTSSSDCTDTTTSCTELPQDLFSEVVFGNLWMDEGDRLYGEELTFYITNPGYCDEDDEYCDPNLFDTAVSDIDTYLDYAISDVETLYSSFGDSINAVVSSYEILNEYQQININVRADVSGVTDYDSADEAYFIYYTFDDYRYQCENSDGCPNSLNFFNISGFFTGSSTQTFYVCDEDYTSPQEDDCKVDDDCDNADQREVYFYNFLYTLTDRTPIASVADEFRGYCTDSFLDVFDEEDETEGVDFESWANEQYDFDNVTNTLTLYTIDTWSDSDTWPFNDIDVPQVVVDADPDQGNPATTDGAFSSAMSTMLMLVIAFVALIQ